MLKKLSAKTNFILIGIVVGIVVGVSIRQAFGQADTSGTVRADNLTVATSGQNENGLAVANGNLLVPNGNIGIGITTPTAKLDVAGDIKSATQLCVGATCVNESELQAMKSQAQLGSLTITTTSIPDATVGVPYTFTFEATGGTVSIWNLDPYDDVLGIGGLKWRNSNSLGIIRGTPTTAGTYKFTVMINGSVSKEFTLVIKLQGSTPPSIVTPGTMTGTGTVSDPYKCPFIYTSAGGGGPMSCLGRSDVIDTCCKSGSMTSCELVNGGVSIVGSGCHYISPSSQPEKHLGVAVDQGLAWFATYPTSGGNSKSPREVGTFCQYGSHDWVYEQAPYTDKDDNVVSGAKIYSGNDCVDKIGSNGWCYRAEKWVQPCIN